MNLLELLSYHAEHRLPQENIVVLQTLIEASRLFSKHLKEFQDCWENDNYSVEEQRHVAQLIKAFVNLIDSLEGNGDDPMLWLGVLGLGEYLPPQMLFKRVSPGELYETVRKESDRESSSEMVQGQASPDEDHENERNGPALMA